MFIPHKKVPKSCKTGKAVFQLKRCLGKTRRLPDGKSTSGSPVKKQSHIAPCPRGLFPDQAHIPALLHDVGKVWAYFQNSLQK